MDFAYYFRTKKSRFSSPSCESGLCVLLSYLKVAIFKPRLRKWTLRTTFVLKSCDFQAPAARTSRTTFVLKSCDLSIDLPIYLPLYLLSIYLPLYLFIYLASYLSIYLQIYLSLSISVSLSLSIYFSSYLYICLLIYLSVHLSLHLKVAMFNPRKLTSRTCKNAAPATKCVLDLAKVLRLPQNLYLTLRKCCACHEFCT